MDIFDGSCDFDERKYLSQFVFSFSTHLKFLLLEICIQSKKTTWQVWTFDISCASRTRCSRGQMITRFSENVIAQTFIRTMQTIQDRSLSCDCQTCRHLLSFKFFAFFCLDVAANWQTNTWNFGSFKTFSSNIFQACKIARPNMRRQKMEPNQLFILSTFGECW